MKIKTFLFLMLFLCGFARADADWKKIDSGTLAWLHSVYFLDAENGWITGSQGTFLKTSDGGETWHAATKFTDDTIRDVYFADARNGWILCERDVFALGKLSPSYIMKTANGGATWEKIEFGDERVRISRLFFRNKNLGYALGEGGAIYALADDPKKIKKIALPVYFRMLDGAFADDSRGLLVGGGGSILFSEDAGANWNRATIAGASDAKLNAVFFVNRNVGWTVGADGKIFTTNNGGKFWREQKSGVNKELTDVYFRNTAEGFAVAGDGTFLSTTTAGNIWTIDQTGGKSKIEKMSFTGKKGFAVGFGGTIMVYEAGLKSSQ